MYPVRASNGDHSTRIEFLVIRFLVYLASPSKRANQPSASKSNVSMKIHIAKQPTDEKLGLNRS